MYFDGHEYKVEEWNNQKMGGFIAIDTETTVLPFHLTPELVTVQVFDGGDTIYYVPLKKLRLFLNMHYESYLIFMNAPFDMDVIGKYLNNRKLIFDLYDRNRVRDIGIMYKLLHLAAVGYIPFKSSLAFLTEKFLNTELEKDDEVRCTFAEFLGKPISEIPQNHLEYGAKDAIATFHIYWILIGAIKDHDRYNTLLTHDIQVKGDLALKHIHKNGIGFDLKSRDFWLKDVDQKIDIQSDRLATWGLVRGVSGYKSKYDSIIQTIGLGDKVPFRYKDLLCEYSGDNWIFAEEGSLKNTNTKVEVGEIVPKTPLRSAKAEDLLPYKDDHFIGSYLEYQTLEKASNFVREINTGVVHPSYNSIVNTGRTSSNSPNFQNLPRMGGIREMFIPKREGNVFLITDYSTLELCTLAQVMYSMFGYSEMRNQINQDIDLHRFYASVMHSCNVNDVTKAWRSEAKAANFGFPGGLGLKTFIQFSAGYGLSLSLDQAVTFKEVWHTAFPETRDYLAGSNGYVYTLTGRKRGNTTFCAEKNTPFQGLAADGAKLSLYEMDKAGFDISGFVHDEIITEVSEDKAKELLQIQEKIMIDTMKKVVPDVKISVESNITDKYMKF